MMKFLFAGNNIESFLAKIRRKYLRPRRVVCPKILSELRELFGPLVGRFGIRTFCATGSMIFDEEVDGTCKDYDVAVILDDLDVYLDNLKAVHEALPKFLNRVPFDYFFQTDFCGFFLNLDIFSMKLYKSVSTRLLGTADEIVTIPPTYGRIYRDNLVMGAFQQMEREISKPQNDHKAGQRKSRWNRVIETWKHAEKAISLAMSLSSGFLGETDYDRKIFSLRLLSCHGNKFNGGDIPPCQSRGYSASNQFHFCNDCGCGERELARISDSGSPPDRPVTTNRRVKLRYRYLACPLRRPGFSNAEVHTLP